MNIKKLSCLATALITTVLAACHSNANQNNAQTAATAKDTSSAAIINVPEACYVFDNGKDKIVMQIAIQNNMATGDLMYSYFEKDKNKGTIQGQMNGDTLFGTYTFMSEGKTSSREVAFLKKGDAFIEGYGSVNPTTGEPDLTDRSALKFENNFVLKQTACAKDEHGCMSLIGMKWSAIKNDCVDLAQGATTLNPIEIKDKGKAPAYLIFSDDRSKAELYLPENNNAVMLVRKGGEGGWTWEYQDFKLIPWKGYVLQKNGVAVYGGG